MRPAIVGAVLILVVLGAGAGGSCGSTCGLALVQRIDFPPAGSPVQAPCCGGSVYQDVNLTVEDLQIDLTNSSAAGRVDAFLTTGDCPKLFDLYTGTPTAPLCSILIGPVTAGSVSPRRSIPPGRYRLFAQAWSATEGSTSFVFDLGIWSDDCRNQRLGPSSVNGFARRPDTRGVTAQVIRSGIVGRVSSSAMASDHSAIEWTEATWNPTTGCTKVSPGCDRCYAERITQRFPKTFPHGFNLTLRPAALDIPLHWKRPRVIFVNSMSDLFHKDVPDSYLQLVFDVMRRTPQHTYQILTKRAERLSRAAARLSWPGNVWMGVSVESPAYAWRIDYLRRVHAAVRFVSAEPLLSPLPNLNLSGIHWLIAGGESQAGCRRAEIPWFRELRDQCIHNGVAFFLKQLGGHPSKRGGDEAVLDGRRWTQMPAGTIPAVESNLSPIRSSATAGGWRSSGQSARPSDSLPRSRASRAGFP